MWSHETEQCDFESIQTAVAEMASLIRVKEWFFDWSSYCDQSNTIGSLPHQPQFHAPSSSTELDGTNSVRNQLEQRDAIIAQATPQEQLQSRLEPRDGRRGPGLGRGGKRQAQQWTIVSAGATIP